MSEMYETTQPIQVMEARSQPEVVHGSAEKRSSRVLNLTRSALNTVQKNFPKWLEDERSIVRSYD